MSKPRNYIPTLLITTAVFVLVVLLSIAISPGFGDKSLEQATATTGIQPNQSLETMNTEQQASVFTASALQKIPPDPVQFVISVLFAIVLLYIVFKVIAKYCSLDVVKSIFFLYLFILTMVFIIALSKLLFGSGVFTLPVFIAMVGTSLLIVWGWFVHPEWWVVDILAVIIAVAGASIIGSSFEPLWVIVGLLILSIYDYLAVMRSNLMMNLAKMTTSFRLPSAFILPYDFSSSLIKDGLNFDKSVPRDERKFMLLGTGDLLIPTILAVSTGLCISLTAGLIVGAGIITSYIVMFVLMFWSKYSAKMSFLPGLPFLCSGAIISYLLAIMV